MEEDFRPIRYPKYSCRFNSIESLFGLVKNKFRKINLEMNLNHVGRGPDVGDLRLRVDLALQIVTQDLADRMLVANRKYIDELTEMEEDSFVEQQVE